MYVDATSGVVSKKFMDTQPKSNVEKQCRRCFIIAEGILSNSSSVCIQEDKAYKNARLPWILIARVNVIQ